MSISKFSSYGYTTCKGTEEFKKKMEMFSRRNMKSDYQVSGKRGEVEEGGLRQCMGVSGVMKNSVERNRSEVVRQVPMDSKFTTATNIDFTMYAGFGKRASSQADLSNRGRKMSTPRLNGKSNSKDKLILLNHMMKPIVYTSSSQY